MKTGKELWGKFEVTIYENIQLLNVEKLKEFLERTIFQIYSISLTENNYDVATGLIKNRFGKNLEIIVRSHANKLLNKTSVISGTHFRELR